MQADAWEGGWQMGRHSRDVKENVGVRHPSGSCGIPRLRRAEPGTDISKLSVPGYGIDRDPVQNQNKIARSKAGDKAFP